jgi:hypothetical protein
MSDAVQVEYVDAEIVEDKKHNIGRPPAYTDPNVMQTKIDQFFKDCEGKPILNDKGEFVLNKYGEPIILNKMPPTVTGLALALGFNSRMSLLNYQADAAFMDVITRAKARIEHYVEGRLFDKDGVQGAKFHLINNFKGWKEDTNNIFNFQNNFQLPAAKAEAAQLKAELKQLESGSAVATEALEK